jgi:hypothetical protein
MTTRESGSQRAGICLKMSIMLLLLLGLSFSKRTLSVTPN